MNTYAEIKKLSDAMAAAPDEEATQYDICWSYSAQLVKAVESDLRKIAGGTPRVISVGFRVGDLDHQGADSCRVAVRYDKWDDFEVIIECLINLGIVRLQVRKRPQKAEFEPIANKLDKGNNLNLSDFEKGHI